MKKIILLLIVGLTVSIATYGASVTFNKVYPGTGTSYTLNSSSISWTTPISGSSYKFTSANPADVTFSGNNVAGQLTYTSGGQNYAINGVISRKVGNNQNYSAFYFVESTVLGGNTLTGKAWLLIVPTYESTFVDNSNTNTNSAPVNTSLNAFLTAQSTNNPPVITSNGGGASAAISIVENTTAVTTVTSTDPNAGDTKVYSITGGVDASKFTINSSTGVLTFISAPDYENPTDAGLNNVYDVQVTVTDGQGATDVQAIAVTITNVNDNAPVITSNGGGTTATINVTAGTTAVTTNTATDADYGDVLTYSISGTDASLFTIDPSSGALVFKSAATVGTDKVVVVTVTDALGHTDTQTLTVHVTATDTTAPTLLITSSDSNLSAGESCTITFKFSELVQGFTFSDVNVVGGTLGSITQSGSDPTVYTATFTQSGSNLTPSVSVSNNTYTDLNNNNGTGNTLNMVADITAPTVAVSFASPDIAYGETDVVTFTFSENPGSSFSLSDVTVTNAVLSNLIQTGTPTIWTATIQQESAIDAPVVTVQNHSYTDLAGNLGTSGTATIPLVPPSIDLANTPTSDTGYSSIDNITTNRKPVVTGFVDSGTSTVTIQVDYYVGAVLTTLTYNNVAVNGTTHTYSLDLSSTSPSSGTMPVAGLPEGYVTLIVTTPTSATASSEFLIDLTAPVAPTANNLTTYDQSPTLTGTATVADGDIFTVNVNGVTYTNGDGNLSLNGTNWTLNIPFANRISAGGYTITAKTTDPAGNFTTGTGTLTINASTVSIDLKNDATNDTGTSSTDNITSNRKPILTGVASGSDATVKVTVVSGGVTYTYNSVAVSGNAFSLDLSSVIPSSIVPTGSFPSAGLPEGTVQLTVEGNTSGAVGANSFVIDISAPSAPTVNSQTTTDTTPVITGTGTFVSGDILKVTINSVTYTSGDGNLSYNIGAGTWSLTIPGGNALIYTSYPTTAYITDLSGNISATGNGTTTIVSATATIDLANTSASDTGTSSTDNLTSNRKPVITGTASNDAVVTVTVTSGGTTYTYNNVSVSGGNWSLDLSTASTTSGAAFPGTGLTTGTWTLGVSGNTTGATGSNSFVEDYTAPTTPTVTSQSTWDTTPIITGTATVGAGDILRVTINGITYTNGDGNLTYSAGTWSLTIPVGNSLAVAAYPTSVTVTDAAGNVATGNGTTTITQPTVSADLANTTGSDTGTSSTDNLTSNRKPVITGTASDDAVVTVTVTSGGTTYTYNNVSVSGGNWSLDLSTASTTSGAAFPGTGLTTGTWTLGVSGNTTGATGSNSFVEDYTAPAIPTVNTLRTIDTTPVLTGSATVSGTDIFTVTVNGITYTNGDGNLSYNAGSGTWSLAIPAENALSVSFYTIVATVTDEAGNTSSSNTTNQLEVYAAQGDVQTYNIVSDPTFTTANITWDNGSKTSRVVFMKAGTGTCPNPTNNTTYSASTNWDSKGSQLASSGYYCIYSGTGSAVNMVNLYPGQLYTIQAFEFSGSAGSETYLTTVTGVNNPNTVTPWPTTTFYNSNGVTSQESWSVAARWDHGVVPTTGLHPAVLVYIDGNCIVNTGETAQPNNLTIKAAHNGIVPKLTVAPAARLNVVGSFANNGASSALVVKSSATLPNGTLTYGTGTVQATVEMYSIASWNLANEINNKYKWQFFGIPVKTITAGSTFNFNNCYVRKWDESVRVYEELWVKKPDGTTLYQNAGSTMNYVDGYELVQQTPTTYTFAGELVHEDVVRSLSYHADAVYPGQNVMGNPFTAAIDISTIQFGPNTEEAVYQYNTGTYKDWNDNGGGISAGTLKGKHIAATKNTAGKNNVIGQIPSMQGFLVKCTGSGGSITIPYTTSLAVETELRKTKQLVDNRDLSVSTRIDLLSNNSADKVWIFTDPSCTRKFDNGWDGRKIIGSALQAQLYAAEIDDNYQIDGVKDMNETVLGFNASTDKEYTLTFTHENTENVYSEIYLKDLVENKIIDVTLSGSKYSFSVGSNPVMINRFMIITNRNKEANSEINGNIKLFNTSGEVIIQNKSKEPGRYLLYNTAGNMVQVKALSSEGITTVSTVGLAPGIYVARAEAAGDKVTKRIIIY